MTVPTLVIGGVFTEQGAIVRPLIKRENIEYRIATGKKYEIWLYTPDNASNTFCSGGPGSRGFGGSTVRFKLFNGLGHIDLKGPWHSNTDSLLRDTGIDIRDKFRKWGCIGTGRDFDQNTNANRITDLIWFDADITIGTFDRIEEYAQKLADERNQTLYYYEESEGGSSWAIATPGFDRAAQKAHADKFWLAMENEE